METLNLEQFQSVISVILDELSAIIVRDGDSAATETLHLRAEVDEALKLLRDPKLSRGQVLAVCFGLVDEFVRSRWTPVTQELLAAYNSAPKRVTTPTLPGA